MQSTSAPPIPDSVKNNSYTAQFFVEAAQGSLNSARLVLGLIFDLYKPASVLDVGCGSGAWLAAAEELGVTKLVGVDGPWVDPTQLLSKRISFTPVDLEAKYAPVSRFDLCISMEVAEHLSPPAAPRFIANLCAASDVVLFSAAIREQGGTMHLNEQWQSYWADLFKAEGYDCHDFIRPQTWNDHRVDRWYRQNTLLYIKRGHPLGSIVQAKGTRFAPMNVVHPEVYEANLENYKRALEHPSLRFCYQLISRYAKQVMKRSFGSRRQTRS